MISVIIPTFKRPEMLFFEIDKIFEQSYKDIEIIVINDDIENDPTDEIVKKYPQIKYIKHKRKIGPGQKRQLGFSLSTGDYIYTPDDDDYLIDNDFFLKAITIMEEDTTVMFVSGNSVIKFEEEKDEEKKYERVALNVKGKFDGIKYLEHMQGKYMKPLSSFPTVFRKKAFEDQCFMDQIETSDSSLYMLASLSGSVYFIEDYVGIYRVHNRSLTTKKSSSTWINNVLRQKERIYLKAKENFERPDVWWLRHVYLSYRFYANTSKSRKEKFKLLKWIYKHNYGYVNINMFLLKELCILIFNK